MKLPRLEDLDVSGKRVLVRVDLDYEILLLTLEYLAGKAAKIILLGHRGRPGGKVDESLSLKPAGEKLEKFLKERWGKERMEGLDIFIMENLRFNPGEEVNDSYFAEHLATEGDVFVNEAFATSHREHASIVGLPRFLPHAAGRHFVKEIENLSRIFKNPKRPVVVIIGGLKKDKASWVDKFKGIADKILVGGRLSDYLRPDLKDEKIIVANLLPDKEDITVHSIEQFEEEIRKAGTIVAVGPMGKFEEEGHRMGTERILKSVAASSAFKVAGGGNTKKAISMLGLTAKFDWISVGGGATLEFLAEGTLPGIKALLD